MTGAGAHSVAEQATPGPRQIPLSAVQAACVRVEQLTVPAALVMQHAPVGVSVIQEALVQMVPAPRQRPWTAAQSASVVTVQTTPPLGLAAQQAPVLVPVCARAEWVKPSAAAQHSAAALPRTTRRANDENIMENLLNPRENMFLDS